MKIACRLRPRAGSRGFDRRGKPWLDPRAAQIADPNSGCWFHTYAAYWIEKAIRQALELTAPMVYIPVETMQLMRRWRRAEQELAGRLGRMPSFEEIDSTMGLCEKEKVTLHKGWLADRHRLEYFCSIQTDSLFFGTDHLMIRETENAHSQVAAVDDADEQAFVLRQMGWLTPAQPHCPGNVLRLQRGASTL